MNKIKITILEGESPTIKDCSWYEVGYSANLLRIVAKFRSELINFYSLWNHQKAIGLLYLSHIYYICCIYYIYAYMSKWLLSCIDLLLHYELLKYLILRIL